MAEPVFDEHPLEEYFRRAGETFQTVPGGLSEFNAEPDDNVEEERCAIAHRLPSFMIRIIELVNSIYPSKQSPENAFAERFKYDVISSSLLSTSIAAPPSATRRTFSPDIPGKLELESEPPPSPTTLLDHRVVASPALSEFRWSIALIGLASIALAIEYYFVAIFLIGGATFTWHAVKANSEKSNVMTATLQAVNDVISAGNVWDSVVNEAITIIEKEERSIFYGPSNPLSPSSGLRVSLQSSLHTTQTQCDNVRQLLSALTDPTQLSQLAEMYAPASPMRPAFTILDQPRPLSVPIGRQRTTSAPMDKRATWNGSYAALALAGSPQAHAQQRRRHRQSDLAFLFDAQPSKLASISAPASPHVPEALQDVQEEDADSSPEPLLSRGEYFGAAALELQRKRRSAALETFGVPPPSYSSHSSRSHRSTGSSGFSPKFSTFSSSSRFTAVHTTRHPLSLSGLQLALHAALSAKRYACSHLLALRFDEDEDDAYWEDVRSVMTLLTSTFEDASSRLMQALNDAEQKRVRDERPSPEPCPGPSSVSHAVSVRTMAEMVSFAPMPSHLTRFAAHVDAISTALNDAREHLEECVASLREPIDGPSEPVSAPIAQEHPAFQAYDRLRKELGFALRECERGRERLLDIVSGPQTSHSENADVDPDDPPGLGQDSGSDTSEKFGPHSPAMRHPTIQSGERRGLRLSTETGHEDEDLDDVTAHLLLTASSHHLPPLGVEQVFEADTGSAALYTRERSKLSREERIKLARARRESGALSSDPSSDPYVGPSGERWGPGGEVVQELKDVIWKVSEKRRKLVKQPDAGAETLSVAVDDTPRTPEVSGSDIQES